MEKVPQFLAGEMNELVKKHQESFEEKDALQFIKIEENGETDDKLLDNLRKWILLNKTKEEIKLYDKDPALLKEEEKLTVQLISQEINKKYNRIIKERKLSREYLANKNSNMFFRTVFLEDGCNDVDTENKLEDIYQKGFNFYTGKSHIKLSEEDNRTFFRIVKEMNIRIYENEPVRYELRCNPTISHVKGEIASAFDEEPAENTYLETRIDEWSQKDIDKYWKSYNIYENRDGFYEDLIGFIDTREEAYALEENFRKRCEEIGLYEAAYEFMNKANEILKKSQKD